MIYQQLEKEFAKFCNKKYAVALNSGTSALHLALIALGVKKGDEVIIPDLTFVACAFAVSYIGAIPVFVDVKDDFTIDPKLIEKKITKKTKAIMAVHLYGSKADMKAIMKIARKNTLKVIEDCSECHEVELSNSDVAIYSLQESKQIHCQEGGMLVTNRKQIADEVSKLKTFYHNGDYYHKKLSFNYRMAEAQALLALQSLHYFIKNPREWGMAIICDNLNDKKKLLKKDGVRTFFKPLSSLLMYNKKSGKNALKFSKLGVFIPYKKYAK